MGPTSSPVLRAQQLDRNGRDHQKAALHATANFNLRAQVEQDHTQAALAATAAYNVTKDAAAGAGMTIEGYMRASGTLPVSEFMNGTLVDPMDDVVDPTEADYMRATNTANKREAIREALEGAREARAISNGLTVEEYLNAQ